jgi:Trypsin
VSTSFCKRRKILDENLIFTKIFHRYRTNGRQLKIRLGEWDAGTATEPIAAQEYNVQRIFVHPQFTAGNLRNNVAILRLVSPVPVGQTPTITTACLPSTLIVGQLRCMVAGEKGKNFYCDDEDLTFNPPKVGGETTSPLMALIRPYKRKLMCLLWIKQHVRTNYERPVSVKTSSSTLRALFALVAKLEKVAVKRLSKLLLTNLILQTPAPAMEEVH